VFLVVCFSLNCFLVSEVGEVFSLVVYLFDIPVPAFFVEVMIALSHSAVPNRLNCFV
jgi:hypothetical protein